MTREEMLELMRWTLEEWGHMPDSAAGPVAEIDLESALDEYLALIADD